MTAVYLFAGLLALLVAVGLLVSPLLEREPTPADEASPADRRDQELETLREVEFEYRTGKLSDEDYRELRARHGQAAVEARREAEAGGRPGTGRAREEAGDGPDAGAEGTGAEEGQAVDGDVEPPPAAGEPGPPDEPRSCPDCGAEARPHARFCSRCGASLEGDDG